MDPELIDVLFEFRRKFSVEKERKELFFLILIVGKRFLIGVGFFALFDFTSDDQGDEFHLVSLFLNFVGTLFVFNDAVDEIENRLIERGIRFDLFNKGVRFYFDREELQLFLFAQERFVGELFNLFELFFRSFRRGRQDLQLELIRLNEFFVGLGVFEIVFNKNVEFSGCFFVDVRARRKRYDFELYGAFALFRSQIVERQNLIRDV